MTVGTNVPSVTFGPIGFVTPDGPAILAGEQQDINAAFNNTLNYQLTTPQGQLAVSYAAVIQNVYQIFCYYTQQVDPAYSSGRMQDAICRIYDLERDPSEPTVLQINCTGGNVLLPAGSQIKDTSGNLYRSTDDITIPVTGSIVGSFSCTLPGPVPVPSANSVSIYQAIPGWDTVTVVSGIQGVDVESRQSLELRRQDSVAGNSFGAIGSIIGAVAKVPGVLDYYGYNNNTAAPVTIKGVTISAYSIYICVAGGSMQDVGTAILSKKGGGAPMVGNTTVVVYDENPLYAEPIPYTIIYQIPAPLQTLWRVLIVTGPTVPSNAAQLVQDALIAAVTGQSTVQPTPPKARIGAVIYASSYVGAINALGTWAQVASITIGSANTPGAVVVGHIAGTLLTVTAVTSGTIAVGQALTDPLGLILNGTSIASFGTGSGGIGTYNLNQSQTVAGATFTGTGSGTNLTVTAVTGVIGIGNVISGTGVTSGTTIVSQTSGTTGGAGVYVTSVATTSSGAAITANSPVSASAADRTNVNVRGDQIPQITAANISVGLS